MHRFAFLFRHDTVRSRLNVIIALIVIVLAFGLVNFLVSVKIMSGIRAYVGGEGLWSKAQKEAVNNLVRYSRSQNEADYTNYLKFLQVPMGDKEARLELDKQHPDRALIQQGFVRGSNNPSDVGNMVFLYRRFRHISYIDSAIKTWTMGDAEIVNLTSLGRQIHTLNTTPLNKNDPEAKLTKEVKVDALLEQVYATDVRSTSLENKFSATLGDGSRYIAKILTELTALSTTLLGVLIVAIAVLIAKAIVRLDEAKTDFVSLASHQLRTPLTTMRWHAESLLTKKGGNLTTGQRAQLVEIYKGGHRMAHLIRDILDVSSIDLDTYRPEPSKFDIRKVLDTVTRDFRNAIEEKDITLTTNMDSNIQKVNLDQFSLTAILQNLISNSVKYTPHGGRIGVTIDIKKANLLVQVSDTGIGIPKPQQPKIYTKFFIADNAKALESDHTGLGLYIVKSMVDRLGGKIQFDSAENIGTCFYVRIPLHGYQFSEKKYA